jgi:hypothetical protein
MGYYWDRVDHRWVPRPRWELSQADRHRIFRRRQLLLELIAEIKERPREPPTKLVGDDAECFALARRNERAVKLYARLLSRSLIATDELLMKELGRQIVDLTAEDEKAA